MFKGSFPALITPFSNGQVDKPAFKDFVSWQIGQGSHGLVPVGTTGESPTLGLDEHREVVSLCVEAAAGRVPVIAGAGSNNTSEAVELTKHAAKAGAAAVLVVVPYYNRPTPEGLYQHFKAVAGCADIPVIIYNVPARSALEMTVETLGRLSKISNIVGTKDATAKIQRVSQQRIACGTDFVQLSGEDGTALGFNAHGGQGCISVTANVAPALCAQFQNACQAGDYAEALQLQDRLMPLHDAMFCEASPGPAKFGASLLGHGNGEVRLPMTEISDAGKATVRAAMVHAGVLNG